MSEKYTFTKLEITLAMALATAVALLCTFITAFNYQKELRAEAQYQRYIAEQNLDVYIKQELGVADETDYVYTDNNNELYQEI